MRQRLETDPQYSAVEHDADVIELLKLIRKQMFNYQSHKHSAEAIHEALHKFYTPTQGRNQDNQAYFNKFKSLVEVINTVGG
mmetsp:Transcript_20060/g.58036  ORF Transcript_20060/g.58036 Transcript_20060/m.58036 type:complete len:82 (+) Transcript_20060:770-1015(+)